MRRSTIPDTEDGSEALRRYLAAMSHTRSNWLQTLLSALILVGLSALARAMTPQIGGMGISIVLFYPVVVLCAWRGGLWLGALATALSVVSICLLSGEPALLFAQRNAGMIAALSLEGLGISYIFESLILRTQREAKERADSMRIFITQAPVAIAMFDNDMRYVAASRRWLHDFNLEDKDVIGASHYQVFPEIGEEWKRVHQRALRGEVVSKDEDLFMRSDGSKQWLRWEVRPWTRMAAPESIGGIIIFCEDISARKEAQERHQSLLAKSQADNMLRLEAEKINQAKDEFISSLSHELRTPLQSILGWIQLIKRAANDPARLSQALEAIERSALNQSLLISDILDINRITSGKLRLNLSDVSITQTVAEAIQSARPAADQKGITLVAPKLTGDVMLRADPQRLQQCLWNLLSNAIKFTPARGVITIDLKQTGESLELSVTDTGLGIEPAMLDRVFERFVQADMTSTRTHGGLGIGLAIVKQLVELHGGTIHAESAGRGRGSRFSFTLPINTTVRPEHPGITPNYAGLKDPHSLLNKKILIVDDELDIREVLRGFLEDCGATVSTASSAKEALEKALEADFDLVLSDISMPNRDGYALIEDLRRLKPSPPVIALTAYASEQAKLRALTAGFVAHVAKPVELSELLEVVLSSVSQRPNTANHG